MTTTKESIASVADQLGLTIHTEFVPWSQSRSKNEKQPSLNWIITLRKDGRDVLTTDYMAGCGHCPSYERGNRNAPRAQAVDAECVRLVRAAISKAKGAQ